MVTTPKNHGMCTGDSCTRKFTRVLKVLDVLVEDTRWLLFCAGEDASLLEWQRAQLKAHGNREMSKAGAFALHGLHRYCNLELWRAWAAKEIRLEALGFKLEKKIRDIQGRTCFWQLPPDKPMQVHKVQSSFVFCNGSVGGKNAHDNFQPLLRKK